MCCFLGLSHSEAKKLDSFRHFRKAKNPNKKSIEEMGDLSPAIDFLDTLSDDIPEGETPSRVTTLELENIVSSESVIAHCVFSKPLRLMTTR